MKTTPSNVVPDDWNEKLLASIGDCLAQVKDYQAKGALPLQLRVYGLRLLKEVVESEARHLHMRLNWPHLTAQQLRVLTLASHDKSDREIANELCLSPKTAQTHIRNACQRLGVSGRLQAAYMAMALGMIPLL